MGDFPQKFVFCFLRLFNSYRKKNNFVEEYEPFFVEKTQFENSIFYNNTMRSGFSSQKTGTLFLNFQIEFS
jgi:hypothetical protein